MSLILPDLVTLLSFNGKWDLYIEEIYKRFKTDFIESKPTYKSQQVNVRKHPYHKEKEGCFWHLISEGNIEEDRLPDLRRCERISWIRPIIENYNSNNICCWISNKSERKRVLIALDDFSYLVVLEPRPSFTLLITAYYLEKSHSVKKKKQEFENWKKAGGTF